MIKQLSVFFDELNRLDLPETPTEQQIQTICALMVGVAASVNWDELGYRMAGAGEELVHPLGESRPGGPSLYIVSDGPGITSPPHEHKVWAAICGMSGNELNVIYRKVTGQSGYVEPERDHEIRAAECVFFDRQSIHSTIALGTEPTFHLHLYGAPLHSLPTFSSRCFKVLDARN